MSAKVITLKSKARAFEVHEHCILSGPRLNKVAWNKFSHSHDGGDTPHDHPHTGPSSYTIDKDDWFRATGMQGGGRKKFTPKPSGEQLPMRVRTAEEQSFEVHVMPPPKDFKGQGAGVAPIARMMLACGMKPEFKR